MSSKYLGTLTILSVVILCFVTPAAAAVSLSIDTTYDGTEADAQRIQSTLTLSPSDAKMQDVSLRVSSTDQSFLNEDSFEVTTPGNEGVNVTYNGNGRFIIQNLDVNQQVTIEFVTYPKTIKETSLDVAMIDISYIQNGQELTEERTITADMSSSSHFALQSAQDWQLITIILGVLLILVGSIAIWLALKLRNDGNPPGPGGRKRPPSASGSGSGNKQDGPPGSS